MRSRPLILFIALILGLHQNGRTQNFSTRGKDFWVAYGYAQRMLYSSGVTIPANSQEMVLYFTTDRASTVTVSIPGTGYTRTYNVPADTTIATEPIPKSGPGDVRLIAPSSAPEDKGIHVTSTEPISAYAHIYSEMMSGATVLFPTPTLGKEYYSINYRNTAAMEGANGWFYVVAVDTGITTVEIIPKENAIGHPAGVPFTVTLTQGQVYNVMGEFNNSAVPYPIGSDLTGSTVRSIAGVNGLCKRIGVFSGSGAIMAVCNGEHETTHDNYMVQAFPKNVWGKKYVTSPAIRYGIADAVTTSPKQIGFYRVSVQDPSTVVRVDGSVVGLPLNNNFYYQLPATREPMLIEADKPVLVSMYFSSRKSGCDPFSSDEGDPEVVYLSPVEQGINRSIWNATSFRSTDSMYQYVNVVIPNGGTAISSFRLDGNTLPPSTFVTHPTAPSYSYASIRVHAVWLGTGPGVKHEIRSDSAFNSIAYGYGTAESYGYITGMQLKDRYQYIDFQNTLSNLNDPPSTCRNTPFRLFAVFPYQPTQIKWLFGGLFPDITINSPVHDSSWTIDGRIVYRYTLAGPLTISTPGIYPIQIKALAPSAGTCGTEQELFFELEVTERPKAGFSFDNVCATSPIQFTDTSAAFGHSVQYWNWEFGDGNTSAVQHPVHSYTSPGPHTVNFNFITQSGCLSDTAQTVLTLTDAPVADFVGTGNICKGQPVTFSDLSTPLAGDPIVKWTWNFGDGTPDVISATGIDQTHTYASDGDYTVTLLVESASGCRSFIKSEDITVNKLPLPGFIIPEACVLDLAVPFIDTSSANPATITGWQWNFGDPNATPGNPNTSTIQHPTHYFSVAQTYSVLLIATSSLGCVDSIRQSVSINGEGVISDFSLSGPSTICSNSPVTIRDASTVNFGSITRTEILWDSADPLSLETDDDPVPGKLYAHNYPLFFSPATRTVTIRYTAYSGTNCVSHSFETITLQASPQINFAAQLPVCEDAPAFQFALPAILNGMTGTGIFSGPGTTTGGFFDPGVAGAGTHVIRYTFTGNNGCSNWAEQSIMVMPSPVVGAGPDKIVLQGQSVMLTPTTAGTSFNYLWTPSSWLSSPTILNPVASPPDDTYYILTITNNQGCQGTDSVFVKVLKIPRVPNIFSPNGDGIHDTWVITNLVDYPGSIITIYNRYGQMIHRISNYSSPWDGRINGQPVPVGTYYYIIEPKNGLKPLSGYVDVIR